MSETSTIIAIFLLLTASLSENGIDRPTPTPKRTVISGPAGTYYSYNDRISPENHWTKCGSVSCMDRVGCSTDSDCWAWNSARIQLVQKWGE